MPHLRTADGSFTYISPHFEETYHSRHGALAESRHVFIEAGLRAALSENPSRPLAIFEMGFGSGLNALLSQLEAEKEKKIIHYHSIEAFPLPKEELEGFKIEELFPSPKVDEQFKRLHATDWGVSQTISPYFHLLKEKADFTKWTPPEEAYQLIFYDAFAPRAQAELWSLEITQKLYDMLESGGLLVTYCAQGQFKRNLKAAGFIVEALPGPKGKREMTRARK